MLTAAAALVLAASTVLSVPSPPPPAPAASHSAVDREWAVNRPSRGAHASAIARAATIPASMRAFAAHVVNRESGGNLDDVTSGMGARNPGSSASGRWQFLDYKWRITGGIQYVVSRRLKAFGVPARVRSEIRDYLHRTHISKWPGLYQDIAFVQVVTEGGAHHWNGG